MQWNVAEVYEEASRALHAYVEMQQARRNAGAQGLESEIHNDLESFQDIVDPLLDILPSLKEGDSLT